MHRIITLVIGLGLLALAGCGGDGDCEADLSGNWTGTWTAGSGDSGTWTLLFTQDASGNVSGSLTLTGTVCGGGGSITGTVSGCKVKFGVATTSLCQIDYQGTISSDGNTLNGTWTASGGGLTDTGTWQGGRI
jgi:hypothetical protein